MFCSRCGAAAPTAASFCAACGARIDGAPDTSTERQVARGIRREKAQSSATAAVGCLVWATIVILGFVVSWITVPDPGTQILIALGTVVGGFLVSAIVAVWWAARHPL